LPATIGQDPTGLYQETGSGEIDDLGVWRRALTPLEAASLYTAGLNGQSFEDQPPLGNSKILINTLRSNTKLLWERGTLQQAGSLSGPWTDVGAPATSPLTVTPTETRFYRIKPSLTVLADFCPDRRPGNGSPVSFLVNRERKEFRAGHTKEARVENPAETSAPDPERADEMLVLRCPPCHRQAGDIFFLSLLHSTRNGQIEPDKELTPEPASQARDETCCAIRTPRLRADTGRLERPLPPQPSLFGALDASPMNFSQVF
jgi:hypothetical protein